jgi:hypothetical protein
VAAAAAAGLGYGSSPPLTFPEAVLWIVEMVFMAGWVAHGLQDPVICVTLCLQCLQHVVTLASGDCLASCAVDCSNGFHGRMGGT